MMENSFEFGSLGEGEMSYVALIACGNVVRNQQAKIIKLNFSIKTI